MIYLRTQFLDVSHTSKLQCCPRQQTEPKTLIPKSASFTIVGSYFSSNLKISREHILGSSLSSPRLRKKSHCSLKATAAIETAWLCASCQINWWRHAIEVPKLELKTCCRRDVSSAKIAADDNMAGDTAAAAVNYSCRRRRNIASGSHRHADPCRRRGRDCACTHANASIYFMEIPPLLLEWNCFFAGSENQTRIPAVTIFFKKGKRHSPSIHIKVFLAGFVFQVMDDTPAAQRLLMSLGSPLQMRHQLQLSAAEGSEQLCSSSAGRPRAGTVNNLDGIITWSLTSRNLPHSFCKDPDLKSTGRHGGNCLVSVKAMFN